MPQSKEQKRRAALAGHQSDIQLLKLTLNTQHPIGVINGEPVLVYLEKQYTANQLHAKIQAHERNIKALQKKLGVQDV